MPPIVNFVTNLSGQGVRSGSFVPDGNESFIVVTGLSEPIKHLRLFSIDGSFDAHYAVDKTASMAGRSCVAQNLPGGAGIVFLAPYVNGVAFVNGGVDFDVRNDDDCALNDQTGSTIYWTAFS